MKYAFFLFFLIFTFSTLNSQSTGIGDAVPSSSAVLDVNSTSKGFLPPRMTNDQKNNISSPAVGLIFWCSDCGEGGELYIYDGSNWIPFDMVTPKPGPFLNAQLGTDIEGEVQGDQSAWSVSLSSDANRVAVGATSNDGAGSEAGHVRILEWNGSTWSQLGNDIDGEAAGEESGTSVSLSENGSRVAIGAPKSDGNGTEAGLVRIYEWNGSSWIKLGSDIAGEAAGDNCGNSVSLSSQGDIVAIGAFLNDGASSDATGHVRIFEWDGSNWIQKGSDIDGEAAYDHNGFSVSLSHDGNTVVIGARYNDNTGNNAGQVRVFEWDGSAWVQLGANIEGAGAGDNCGYAVAQSFDGKRIAVGASGNDDAGLNAGHVRIFEWDGSAWSQLGADIDGESAGDNFGFSVSMSSDGNRLAIGAPSNSGSGPFAGHVRIFKWNGFSWNQLGTDIDGEAASDLSGYSISLSGEGSRLVVGAPNNGGNGIAAGHVRVYY